MAPSKFGWLHPSTQYSPSAQSSSNKRLTQGPTTSESVGTPTLRRTYSNQNSGRGGGRRRTISPTSQYTKARIHTGCCCAPPSSPILQGVSATRQQLKPATQARKTAALAANKCRLVPTTPQEHAGEQVPDTEAAEIAQCTTEDKTLLHIHILHPTAHHSVRKHIADKTSTSWSRVFPRQTPTEINSQGSFHTG